MRKIENVLRNRCALLMVLLVVLGGTLGLLVPAEVAQSQTCGWRPILRTYYSDAAHTNVVGQRGLDCSCNDASWGVTSSFVTSQQQCCSFNAC